MDEGGIVLIRRYPNGFGLHSIAKKVDDAIVLIQEYSEEALFLDERGFVVRFSGGKDSLVIARLAEMAGVPFELSYSCTTIDPPELTAFIKKEYPQTVWSRPKKGFFARLPEQIPPTRQRRWCCREYKETRKDTAVCIVGIRHVESPRREKSWTAEYQVLDNGFGLLPILHWTDRDVWKFIDDEGLKYCSLYDEGFSRIGCVGCPMGSSKQRMAQFRRWPAFGRAWRASIFRWYEMHKGKLNNKGKPYYLCEQNATPEDLWFWWLFEGKHVGPETKKTVDKMLMRAQC